MPGKYRIEAFKSDFGNWEEFLEGRNDISREGGEKSRKQLSLGPRVDRACSRGREAQPEEGGSSGTTLSEMRYRVCGGQWQKTRLEQHAELEPVWPLQTHPGV